MKSVFKRNTASIAVVTVILAGCAGGVVHINEPFDVEHARALLAKGNNTIKGNAFLRQKGGGIVTCAGADVYLVPATKYAEERIKALYGSDARETAIHTVLMGKITVEPDYPEYATSIKQTQCDSRGDFIFENVANGNFFIHTKVVWTVGNNLIPEGGSLIKRISLKDGETVSVIMSR